MNCKLILAAGVALMLTFTIGCDGGGGGKEEKRDVSGNSSSSIDSSSDDSSSSGDSSSSATDTSSSSVGDSSSSFADDSSSSGDSSSSSVDGSSSSGDSSSSSANSSSSSVSDSSSSSSDVSSSSVGDLSSSSGVVVGGIESVTIGTQTWMKKNLDVYVEGSKCYDNDLNNCAIYGRLYDWATAMALPEDCNMTTCAGQVQAKHQGICPTGWHIPTDAEWDELYRAVDGSSDTESPYSSPTAGKDLKATSGWNEGGNGTNESGFAALPGGFGGYSYGYFDFVGYAGYWWSASESDAINAYGRGMSYYNESAFWYSSIKADLRSVRCLQD